MVAQLETELKQAPSAAVGAVADRVPASAPRHRAQIDHPHRGQAGRPHQACSPHRIAKMPFVAAEATALLVRKEGFDLAPVPLPTNRGFGIRPIADQRPRRLLGSVPDRPRHDRASARRRHLPSRAPNDLVRRHAHGTAGHGGRAPPAQDVAGGTADGVPASALNRRLPIGAINCASAQEDHRRGCGQLGVDVRDHGTLTARWEVPRLALDHASGQRPGAPARPAAHPHGDPAATDRTPSQQQHQRRLGHARQHGVGNGPKVRRRADGRVRDPAGAALHAPGQRGPRARRRASHRGQLRVLGAADAPQQCGARGAGLFMRRVAARGPGLQRRPFSGTLPAVGGTHGIRRAGSRGYESPDQYTSSGTHHLCPCASRSR